MDGNRLVSETSGEVIGVEEKYYYKGCPSSKDQSILDIHAIQASILLKILLMPIGS